MEAWSQNMHFGHTIEAQPEGRCAGLDGGHHGRAADTDPQPDLRPDQAGYYPTAVRRLVAAAEVRPLDRAVGHR